MPSRLLPAAATPHFVPDQLRRARRQAGLSRLRLATAAGVSAQTLAVWEQGVRVPRRVQIDRLASALGLTTADLLQTPAGPEPAADLAGPASPPTDSPPAGAIRPAANPALAFDQRTNPCVAEVAEESPELFAGWTATDWEELFGTFGVGGALRPEGVRQTAERINRRRRASQQLEVVLQTHLAAVAEELLDALYRLVQPGKEATDRGWQPPARPAPPGTGQA